MEYSHKILDYYLKRLHQNRELSPETILGWESVQAQRARFEAALRLADFRGKKVLDVGCGLGDFRAFLLEKDIVCDYTGMDLIESMIENARFRHPHGKFICADVLQYLLFPPRSFDIIYASGMFNLKLDDNYGFIRESLRKFATLTRETVIFNLLHDRSPHPESSYFYSNPDSIRSLIQETLFSSSSAIILDDYLPNDFTVALQMI